MLKVLVTGANGQLGQELNKISASYQQLELIFADRQTLDITKLEQVTTFVEQHHIDAIVNAAAYTAVDQAEDDSEQAHLVNHQAVHNLGKVAQQFHLKLVHLSTDYVFDGASCVPYTVNHPTNPKGVYGFSKLKGEQALADLNLPNAIVIRTAWVYSEFGANFVKTMLRLGKERENLSVIYDQIGSPTYAEDLARAILDILPQIDNEKVEIYHYTNEGVCSWYDFAQAIFELKDVSCNVTAIASSAYPTKATRPHYSVLDKDKIKTHFGITIPYWRDALKKCLEKL